MSTPEKRRLEGGDDQAKPEPREVKVKLEDHGDDDDAKQESTASPAVRECVVCFRELPLGEESAVCRNQLSSSSSSSAAEVKIRGDHCHCLECFKALPQKQCSVCKAPFFATSGQVMDLESVVQPKPKPNPPQPLNRYTRVLNTLESKDLPDYDANMVAAIIWENERCRLLRDHSPLVVASFLHRVAASNRFDFIKYLIIRETHELTLFFRGQFAQEQVAPDQLESRVKVAIAQVLLNKLTVFFVENRSSRALARIFASAKEILRTILSGAAGPVLTLFGPHPETLRSFAIFMSGIPETAPTTLGTWFCNLALLQNLDAIQWVLADHPKVTPLLNRLNADCFTSYMRFAMHQFATRHLPLATFQHLVAKFPWLVKVAWDDFQVLLTMQGTYHPLALHLYQNHYDQVPAECRHLKRHPMRPIPPELEPWQSHYLFDPVAVKWYCAPHKHIADKAYHHPEVDLFAMTQPGTRVTILGQEPLPVDPIPVHRLHVFYFARANADGSNHRSHGDASFWDIPDEKYDRDWHTGWRYWKLGVLPKTVGAKRIPLVPGTTLVFDYGIAEHDITLVNTPTF